MNYASSATRRQRLRRGATAVEFAIVLPILLTFVWAAFEFTRWAMIRHVADNAAYEAARCVIVPGGGES